MKIIEPLHAERRSEPRSVFRVLVVHNRYQSDKPSGENRVVDYESRLLAEAGHEIIRYEVDSDDIASLSTPQRLRLPLRVVWSAGDARNLRQLLTAHEPHLVHVHNTFPLLSPAVFSICARRGVPVVMTVHNHKLTCLNGALYRDGRPCERCVGGSLWPGVVHGCYRESRLFSANVAAAYAAHRALGTWTKHVDRFIMLSRFQRSVLARAGISISKTSVITNGSPRVPARRRGPGRHFLFMGRLHEEKGLDLAIDAWTPDLGPLLVAGSGPLQHALAERARRLGAAVTFLGTLGPEPLSQLLRETRALVVPSRVYEACPRVISEAYAHGVPVIAPRLGSFPEFVEDGTSGFLFEPLDPHDFARRARRLLDDETSLRLGENASRLYEQRHAPEVLLASLVDVYHRVTQGAAR